MKKFLTALSISLALLVTPAVAASDDCKFPQETVINHFNSNGLSLWQLNPKAVNAFLEQVNKLQEVQYEADMIVFAMSRNGSSSVLFFLNDCANGPHALAFDGVDLWKIFNTLHLGESDFTRYTYAKPV